MTGQTINQIPVKVEIEWVFQTGDAIKATPVVAGNRIVIGSADGYLYCLDLNGGVIWKHQTGNAIEGSAMILDNVVYVGNLDGALSALLS